MWAELRHDSLALHMRHCAMARGNGPRSKVRVTSLPPPRIVTARSSFDMAIAAFSVAVVICGWIIV
jgi:hypothetical protein